MTERVRTNLEDKYSNADSKLSCYNSKIIESLLIHLINTVRAPTMCENYRVNMVTRLPSKTGQTRSFK